MRRCVRVALIVVPWLAIAPSAAYAQASIVGVVKDTSGAVLPGVTVEASSPALIEKTRSVVTDNTGQYRIENLRPGAYAVTFSLAGFNTVKREGIELTGSFTASVNADLRVGALEETITVTGETPVVDVQGTTRQSVLNRELIDALPSGRHPIYLAALLPAVRASDHDVGGIRGMGRATGSIAVHGSRDVRTLVSGLSMHSAHGNGSSGVANSAAFQEIAVDTGGISAEQKEGGVRINHIPRDGGNTPRGYFFGAFANSSMQGDNFTQDLKNRGLGTPDSVKKFWDVNPAFGGPIKKDKIWFHATIRHTGALNYVPMFFNKNAGNPNAWTYEPDTSREAAATEVVWKNANARITWQATPRNKFAVMFDISHECACPRSMTAQTAPETRVLDHARAEPVRQLFFDWTAPVTNRLLLEAAILHHYEFFSRPRPGRNIFIPGDLRLNGVTEQSNNLAYRATTAFALVAAWNPVFQSRISMSYVTGAHAFKVGFDYGAGSQDQLQDDIDSPMSFRFNNGVPNQLTLRATPFWANTTIDADHGLFVQDRWTVKRLTLTAGLRYDYYHSSYPETKIGPGEFVPTRNIVFPKTDAVRWHDLSPRSGVAFDVFGDGKTALKVSLNKYLAVQGASGTFGSDMAPASRLVNATDRSWNDANRDFVPDCDLLNPVANGECGPMTNTDFGTTRPGTTYDPDTLSGWGKRGYNWEFSAGVQRELLSRVSMDVSYFRRWFGNFIVVDDRALGQADFDQFSITAPVDPRLPGGGGSVISGLYNLKPAKFGVPADNFLTFSDHYGKQIEHWNGVDVTVNARPGSGLLLQGGLSSGRTTTDNCEVVPHVSGAPGFGGRLAPYNPSQLYCHVDTAFLSQVKLLGTYTVPRIDLQVTATLQNLPGPEILANYTATNAEVAPSLGRSLAGGARNVTVGLVEPGTLYGERMNQIDLRFGKILTFGRTRVTANLDLYNVLNASPVLSLSNAFATWQRPQSILNARFAKVVVQLDF